MGFALRKIKNYEIFEFGPNNCESGVYFINVLRTNFLYKRHFSSYVLALKELSYKKFARLTLMKLTAGRLLRFVRYTTAIVIQSSNLELKRT